MRRADSALAKPTPDELEALAELDRRRARQERDKRDRKERDEYRAIARPAEVLYARHLPRERVSEALPTWRIRGGRYARPKLGTRDMSKLDVSAELIATRADVELTLQDAASELPRELTLGLRSAVLKERRVAQARRRQLLGDVDEKSLGDAEAGARILLERALVDEYGFLPKYQLRWVGTV